jgi:hypothetical protein
MNLLPARRNRPGVPTSRYAILPPPLKKPLDCSPTPYTEKSRDIGWDNELPLLRQVATGRDLKEINLPMDFIDAALLFQHTSDLTGLQQFQDLCQDVVVFVGFCMDKVFRRNILGDVTIAHA